MKMKNSLNRAGLSVKESAELAVLLNQLLSNYQVFYQNTRGFHWNIKGEKFFELHLKFEELYNNLQVKIDELAERILTLGHAPLHSFSDYLSVSTLPELKKVTGDKKSVQAILDAFGVILPLQRKILRLSGEAGDEGTGALMSDYIREQEKLVWMYSAYLD